MRKLSFSEQFTDNSKVLQIHSTAWQFISIRNGCEQKIDISGGWKTTLLQFVPGSRTNWVKFGFGGVALELDGSSILQVCVADICVKLNTCFFWANMISLDLNLAPHLIALQVSFGILNTAQSFSKGHICVQHISKWESGTLGQLLVMCPNECNSGMQTIECVARSPCCEGRHGRVPVQPWQRSKRHWLAYLIKVAILNILVGATPTFNPRIVPGKLCWSVCCVPWHCCAHVVAGWPWCWRHSGCTPARSSSWWVALLWCPMLRL